MAKANNNANNIKHIKLLEVVPNCPDDKANYLIGGIDEAGCGTLACDVYASCVVLPYDIGSHVDVDEASLKKIRYIKDSKKLSAKKREEIAEYIKSVAIAWGIGSASVEEVDKHNILNARIMAMHRAVKDAMSRCGRTIDELIVDGTVFKPFYVNDELGWIPFTCYENGDSTYMSIAAASILAKTAHDAHVRELVAKDLSLDTKYGWLSNMCYGTKRHLDGIKEHGITEYHRRTFKPVANKMMMMKKVNEGNEGNEKNEK